MRFHYTKHLQNLVFLSIFHIVKTNVAINLGHCVLIRHGTCPDKLVQFFLFTRMNPRNGQLLDIMTDNITLSYFHPWKTTKIIIHGYYSNMDSDYLLEGDYNVVAVDWRVLGQGPFPCYPIAAANVPHVGRCVAQLVQRLRFAAAEDIHVIGFSLGAQVAAHAANYLKPYKLPRITGLDPAKPFFEGPNNANKLDSNDAHFVDVIHTNAKVKGQFERSGDVDFYVNGGSQQPGCKIYEPGFSLYCSHGRAIQYFAESIMSSIGFWGWRCSGMIAHKFGLCSPKSPAILMGEHVSHRARGFIFVETKSTPPYALGPWVVSAPTPYLYYNEL